MSDQEFLQDDGQNICRSMLHLSTATDAAPESDKYTPVYTKRHSHFEEPLPKKATPHPAFSPPNLNGYTKIQLPHSFPAASPLRRTLSEPIYSPGSTKPSAPQESVQFQNSGVTPPRQAAARNSSRSPSFGGSNRARRMKRIRERMKDLWNQVASEDGDEDASDHEPENLKQEESENGDLGNCASQEAVWVEKKGESLVLHFRCPCGNGYEVLLSGSSCYYKLTNF